MFRVSFSVSMPEMEGHVKLGEIISHADDPYVALHEGQDKRPVFVNALKQTMPMFAKVKTADIQISVVPYEVQLLLFDMPLMSKKRNEATPDAKIGYELFQNDHAATLTTGET